jgi:hypothetical protein
MLCFQPKHSRVSSIFSTDCVSDNQAGGNAFCLSTYLISEKCILPFHLAHLYVLISLCRFQAHLLKTSLKDKKLCDHDEGLLKDWTPPPGSQIASLTFGDLDGKELQFPPQSQQRPLKRALCFQANLAMREARKCQQQDPDSWKTIDFADFWSEGLSYVEKVQAWLAGSQSVYDRDISQFTSQSTGSNS